MNKKILLFGIPIFALVVISAVVYYINVISLTVDVKEPFTVQYAIIGDAGNWDGTTTCEAYNNGGNPWTAMPENGLQDVGGLYAGEGRGICFKITNAGQASIPYTITSEVINIDGNTYSQCLSAFGNHELSGTATASTSTITGLGLIVDAGATPVNDCRVDVKVGRGTA